MKTQPKRTPRESVARIASLAPDVAEHASLAHSRRREEERAEEDLLRAALNSLRPLLPALAGKVPRRETRLPAAGKYAGAAAVVEREHFDMPGMSLTRGLHGYGLQRKGETYCGQELFLFQSSGPEGWELAELTYTGQASYTGQGTSWEATCTALEAHLALPCVLAAYNLDDLLGVIVATLEAQIRGSDKVAAQAAQRAQILRSVITLLSSAT